MSQKWSYNNIEFEVDLQDADFAERYEAAFARMEEGEKKMQKAGKNSEIIREYCNLYRCLFDGIYGAGASEKMFNGKSNAGMCEEAYAAFMDAAVRNNEEAMQRRSLAMSRYTPHQNRQQRRSSGKGGGK